MHWMGPRPGQKDPNHPLHSILYRNPTSFHDPRWDAALSHHHQPLTCWCPTFFLLVGSTGGYSKMWLVGCLPNNCERWVVVCWMCKSVSGEEWRSFQKKVVKIIVARWERRGESTDYNIMIKGRVWVVGQSVTGAKKVHYGRMHPVLNRVHRGVLATSTDALLHFLLSNSSHTTHHAHTQ